MKVSQLFLIVLMPFPLLSLEFLTPLLSILLFLLVLCGFIPKIGKYISIAIALAIVIQLKQDFNSYFLPEPMISFLALSCMLRIHFSKIKNDKTARILGILWIASFSLLKTNLSYFFVMIYSVAFIFLTFDKDDSSQTHPLRFIKIKKIAGTESLISLVIISILFLFFPRFNGFFPRRHSPQKGKIGYSKTIDNSSVLNLQQSGQTAFIAETNKRLSPRNLYWRGRIHTYTDGFNWSSKNLTPKRHKIKLRNPLHYKIKYEQDLGQDLILLDTPYKVESSNLRYYRDKTSNSYFFYQKGRKSIVSAVSSLNGYQIHNKSRNKKAYTQLPPFIPKKMRLFVEQLELKDSSLPKIIRKFKSYLIKNKYSYSLSPGDVTTLTKFMNRKTGYCSHYASFLGITLRYLGFQTRLVSGFQGGIFNELGGYYTVSSNDAHAWVEVLDNKRWVRLDPTSFINPTRINLGGETYFTTNESDLMNAFDSDSNILRDLQKAWSFANYKLSLLLDNYDINEQESLSQKLKINRKSFFIIGVFLLLFFVILYLFLPKSKKQFSNKYDKYFNYFIEKMNKKGAQILSTDNLSTIRKKTSPYPRAKGLITHYEELKYSKRTVEIERFKKICYSRKTYQLK